MKKIILLFILLGILASCSDDINIQKNTSNNPQVIQEIQKEVSNFESLSVEDFKKEIENSEVVLIDVRTPGEIPMYGKIRENQQLINYNDQSFPEKISKLDKSKKYAIYCFHGNRSKGAKEYMKKQGFFYVKDLNGGIDAWNRSLETEKNNEKTISLSEVKKHNINSDCWTIIDGKVYDITSFFGKHPGGDGKLEILCGLDGTKDFIGKHGENAKAQIKKKDFYIGDLK